MDALPWIRKRIPHWSAMYLGFAQELEARLPFWRATGRIPMIGSQICGSIHNRERRIPALWHRAFRQWKVSLGGARRFVEDADAI